MRVHELKSGIEIPLSNEEYALVEAIRGNENRKVLESEMNERGIELARKLLSRGVLDTDYDEADRTYWVSELEQLWRE